MDKLFEKGSLDVLYMPVYMKKNRPGTLLKVLCDKDKKTTIINTILTETSSIGVRYYNVKRDKLLRKEKLIKTRFGEINILKDS